MVFCKPFSCALAIAFVSVSSPITVAV